MLINRIQAICRPRGRVVRIRGLKRLLVRAPSLLMLGHALLMLSLLCAALLQTDPGKRPPGKLISALNRLTLSHLFNTAPWATSSISLAQQDRTKEVFWLSFLAVAANLATETLLGSLECRRDEVPAHNLFIFAIVLSEEHPSKHTAVVVWLTVAELCCLAAAGSWQRCVASRYDKADVFG